ncbi:hypothetical protein ABKN59_006965 [Abortiporus biennis]
MTDPIPCMHSRHLYCPSMVASIWDSNTNKKDIPQNRRTHKTVNQSASTRDGHIRRFQEACLIDSENAGISCNKYHPRWSMLDRGDLNGLCIIPSLQRRRERTRWTHVPFVTYQIDVMQTACSLSTVERRSQNQI